MLWQYSYRQVEKMLFNKMHTKTIMNKCYQKRRLTNWREKVAKSGDSQTGGRKLAKVATNKLEGEVAKSGD